MTLRQTFYRACLEQLARNPAYLWGGREADAMDCGGFVERAVLTASAGRIDIRGKNTDGLWNMSRPVAPGDEQPGDLAFYSDHPPTAADPVSHVMVVAGLGQCFGMAWGGSADVDPQVSRALGHVVKVLPVHYRSDFVGFRRLPLEQP